MIPTGQACEHVDPHLAATAERLWPAVAWEIDVLERMADGRVDRAELGMRGPGSGHRVPGREQQTGERRRGAGSVRRPARIPVPESRTPVFR